MNKKRIALLIASICFCGLVIIGGCIYYKKNVLAEENIDAERILTETQLGEEDTPQVDASGVDTLGGSSYYIQDSDNVDENQTLTEKPLD